MRQLIKIFCFVTGVALMLSACDKYAYRNDGGPSNAHVNMTTYDYLNSHPKFDSLVRVIDRAGMKDAVNGNITFFATTNWGIADYVAVKKQQKIIEVGDENIEFSIDDIPGTELSDSLKMYMYEGHIGRENLTTEHEFFNNFMEVNPTDTVRYSIRLRRVQNYSNFLNYVDFVNFTKVIGSLDADELDPNTIPQYHLDRSFDCQTSGIITTTGVIHVLEGGHRLFFNEQSTGTN